MAMVNKQSTLSPPEPVALNIGKGTAELGEIVVFLDGHTETARILEFAGTLAQEHGARPISVFMQPKPSNRPFDRLDVAGTSFPSTPKRKDLLQQEIARDQSAIRE